MAQPKVTTVAAYRLGSDFARDHIEYRPTYQTDWAGWDDRERAAIPQAAASFRPERLPPEGKFSEWHYMILGRERSGRGDPTHVSHIGDPGNDYFFYDKPAVVLRNAASFRAADGF